MIRLERILLSIFSFSLVFCTTKDKGNEFIIQGKFSGSNTDYLILVYIDSSTNIIRDSIAVNNNRFYVEGKLNGSTFASISRKSKANLPEDANMTYFFLEPGKIFIELKEDQFKDAIILGSKTQNEYKDLERLVKPIYSEITPLMLERNKLLDEVKINQDNVKSINDRIDQVTFHWTKKLDKIKTKRLEFVFQNPNSHLSAYWVDKYYFKEMSLDSAKNYYDGFSSEVKSGIYGNELKLKIDKSRTPTLRGDKAPNFELTDLKENKIGLEQFRGKYVLLDFWASWCGPCRKHNPDLIRLYKSFHSNGLEIIGLTSDKQKDNWKKAIKDDGIGIWHHAFSGQNKVAINTEYNITAIPAYILIDQDGYIIDRYLAADNQKLGLEDLEKKLNELFGQ